jgi:hypothetical protein
MEPPSGTGSSASAHCPAHDGICRSYALCTCEDHSHLGLWPPEARLALESWPVLRAGFYASARWDSALPCGSIALSPGTAPRTRWEPACGLCGQHSQLPPPSLARAVSMAGLCDQKASSSEYAAASPDRGTGSSPLARLEPATASAGLSTTAQPTPGGPDGAGSSSQLSCHPFASFPCAAGALSSQLSRTAGA